MLAPRMTPSPESQVSATSALLLLVFVETRLRQLSLVDVGRQQLLARDALIPLSRCKFLRAASEVLSSSRAVVGGFFPGKTRLFRTEAWRPSCLFTRQGKHFFLPEQTQIFPKTPIPGLSPRNTW